ncbi:ribonuclease HI [Myroides sp. M-43]|uniref:ribonuclease HI n=1 Tax=Myroides oncorhynchi TaxID=2893756 RepID=UPI001E5B458D|nr:ribonuclease HI [Myroides oncorhynchi]MCC9042007.1 ribonuclease HI [Myroides oncorhynchi]
MNLPQVILYTDGSSRGNPGPGGYGLILEWAGHKVYKEVSQGYRKTTNNRMELLAVIVGLEMLKNEGTSVLVVSDSKYVVDAVDKRWVFGWEKKAYKDKKNPDLWQRFLKVYRKHNVQFKWVKGHNNHPMNERCDVLAVKAATGTNLLIDEYYESIEG